MSPALRELPGSDLCPCCGGDCCEACAGAGTRDAYLLTLYTAAEEIQDEMRHQRAEALVWQAHERARRIPGDLGELIRGDLAEALKLMGGE